MKTQPNPIEIGIQALWITENEGNLLKHFKKFKRETKDKQVRFIEFCVSFYNECQKPKAWLIEAEIYVKNRLNNRKNVKLIN